MVYGRFQTTVKIGKIITVNIGGRHKRSCKTHKHHAEIKFVKSNAQCILPKK